MADFICEQCGSAARGKAAPCGAEVCRDCCTVCYDKDGFCEVIGANQEKE